MLECKDRVCNEDADTVDEHTSNPETDVFAVRLVSILLSHHPESAEEDEASVDEGVSEPLNEEPCGEASSINTNSVKQWVSHEISLQLSLGQSHLHINIFLVLEVEDAVEKNRQGGHGDIVHLIDQLLVEWLSSEGRVETEVELWYDI